ncbi:putative transmembrane protein, partial [Cryptosporidium felis]
MAENTGLSCEDQAKADAGERDLGENGSPIQSKNASKKVKVEHWNILASLGAVTLVSAATNLILVGALIFVISSILRGVTLEHPKEANSERGVWPNFSERNSRIQRAPKDAKTEFGPAATAGGILPLQVLYNAPLKSLENVDAIILEFEQSEEMESEAEEGKGKKKSRGKRYQHIYHVDSIEREILVQDPQKTQGAEKQATEAVLKFNLTNRGTLSVFKDRAVLRDKLGNEIHEFRFHQKTPPGEKSLRADARESKEPKGQTESIAPRRLISSDSHRHSAHHSLKTQSGYMAAVCKYGCGEMGVTYPYYYRPFFGYGFPLLGTEPYFQSGYGGNVETAMNNNMFNPESASPRPPGLQATPPTSPFSMAENPYSYPYSTSPGGGYYYY